MLFILSNNNHRGVRVSLTGLVKKMGLIKKKKKKFNKCKFIYFIFTHNQLEINHSACRNKDCE